MPSLGPAEILVVLFIALLVFGPKRLPEVARQVGRALNEVRNFQDVIKGELDGVLHGVMDEENGGTREVGPQETRAQLASSTTSGAPPTGAPEQTTPASTNGERNGASPQRSRAPSRFRPPSTGQ
jgi:TatA/E family protein of Tat protein translocase